MKKLTVLFLAFLALGACKKSDDQAKEDEEAILSDLTTRGVTTATRHESGIYYVISDPGSGGHPVSTSKVTVSYKGVYLDGVVFDQTDPGQTVEFTLGGLIEGWQIAIPLLEKGGEGRFWIPSELCYGSNPPQGVRKDAVMVFDIELVDFN
ncbi:MAG: FKBP-type peptidyl-prolyl cis-trans isomerase [Saprospiraceae bacterium]|nr:FKBP-type peptidyl-prolyl cis-trans isomerase [Saprospiraceae bacterium]